MLLTLAYRAADVNLKYEVLARGWRTEFSDTGIFVGILTFALYAWTVHPLCTNRVGPSSKNRAC